MSDEEFLKLGQEFDLDAYIKSLNPPTLEEIIKSLEPIPTLEQLLEDFRHPERQPRIPELPPQLAEQVEDLEARISELEEKSALGAVAAQELALDEAIDLAEQVERLRREAGQPADWYEVVDARFRVVTLSRLRSLSGAERQRWVAANARNREVESSYQQGLHDRGTILTQCQLAIRQHVFPTDHQSVADSLSILANILEVRGSLADAELLSRDALAMYQRLFRDDHPAVAYGLDNLASILHERGALDQAERLNRHSVTMWRRVVRGDHLNVAASLNNLALILFARGALAEAEPLVCDALAMLRRHFHGDQADVARLMNNLAVVLLNRGALEHAELLIRDALAMSRRIFPGDHADVAMSLNTLACLLQDRGALAEAEQLFREALAMSRRLFSDGHRTVAAGLDNLAKILARRGASIESEELMRDALAMRRRILACDNPDVATGLNNLACLLRDRGALDEAEELFREALGLNRRLYPGDSAELATSLSNLADVFKIGGALAEAEPLFREAFDMSERLRTQIIGGEQERAAFAQTLTLSNRALAYAAVLIQLDHRNAAMEALERGRARAALDLLERSGRNLTAEARALGDPERTRRLELAQAAEAQARTALLDAESLLAGRRSERAAWEKITDRPEEERARKLADYDQQIAALNDDVKQKHQALTRAGGDVLLELRGLFPAGKALSTDEILRGLSADEAVVFVAWGADNILTAVAAGGQTTAEIVAKDEHVVQRLTDLATKLRAGLAERPVSATPFDSELAREFLAALLPDALRARVANARRLVILPDGPLSDLPFDALIELDPQSPLAGKALVYAPSATVYLDRKQRRDGGTDARNKINTSAVVLGAPIFDRAHKEPKSPTQGVLIAAAPSGGNAAKAGLRRGDVLLRYDGQVLDDSTPLQRAVAGVGDAVQKGERSVDEPVRIKYWRDGREADVVLPPGKLGVQIQPGKPDEGLRSMALIEQVTRGGGEFAASVNATEQVRLFGTVLRPLPGSEREARAIARLFISSGSRATVLTGPEATVQKLRETIAATPPRYLHLATHGLIGSAERPLDASLALTQPEKPTLEDIGFLRLEDLLSHWGGKLKDCELVVLSACDTQHGQRRGDTVMSLPLGFFFAGARTVVASLWKVDDAATALFMDEFYRNLLERGLPKALALHSAQRTVRAMTREEAAQRAKGLRISLEKERVWSLPPKLGDTLPPLPKPSDRLFEHPYYWAAFILIGAPD